MPARIRRLVCCLLIPAGLGTALAGHPQVRPIENPDAQAWLREVLSHHPGSLDAHAVTIGNWPWERFSAVVGLIGRHAEADAILKAAALYLDISTHMPVEIRPVYPTEGRSLRSIDGRPLDTSNLDTQMWWARDLVNRLLGRDRLDPADRTRALAWYHQASALFAGRLWLADQQWHLEAAAVRFPGDPVVLFDQGCLEETLAAPVIQHAAAAHGVILPAPLRGTQKFPIRPAPRQRDRAEGLFLRSLAAAPSGEAHARLGRLLLERNRVDEAIRHLQSATNDSDDMVRYYAWLFLGQAYATTGAWGDGERALDEALKLFPEAQSAHLARSRLHIRRGDAAASRDSLAPVVDPRRVLDDRAAPWWRYLWCRGRTVERAASHVLPAP
jgi:hypothetical protein